MKTLVRAHTLIWTKTVDWVSTNHLNTHYVKQLVSTQGKTGGKSRNLLKIP